MAYRTAINIANIMLNSMNQCPQLINRETFSRYWRPDSTDPRLSILITPLSLNAPAYSVGVKLMLAAHWRMTLRERLAELSGSAWILDVLSDYQERVKLDLQGPDAYPVPAGVR